MQHSSTKSEILTSAFTLLIGAVGALAGFWLSFPVYILTGPAIVITLLSLAGVRFGIATTIRDAAFLIVGISIGAGVNAQAGAALLRWPLAFVALGVTLFLAMMLSRALLSRGFGYDQRTAVLCATPGHLSFVLGLGEAFGVDVAKIAVVQSVRLFSLTMIVPFAALAFGIEVTGNIAPQLAPMTAPHFAALVGAGLILGLGLKRFAVPAPLLIGGLIVSTLSHVSDLTPGVLHPWLALPAFAVIGTLIGTRFSGVNLTLLKSCLLAGLATTVVALFFALVASIPVAAYLDMPLPHVLVAFAPGGLETMIAMGAVLGANPGFVAAAHVARLLMLILFVPLLLPKRGMS